MTSVVIMGVAGCGKSEIGRRLAQACGLPLVEGDEFHPPANVQKMRSGVPLDDADRAGWLAALGDELVRHDGKGGAVLTCSALKRAYRDVLRGRSSGLRFVHLALTREEALRRVASRSSHFYPTSLVASQFEALEDPASEPGVLVVDATLAPEAIVARTRAWLAAG